MLLLVGLTSLGVDRLRFTIFDRYEKLIVGLALAAMGTLLWRSRTPTSPRDGAGRDPVPGIAGGIGHVIVRPGVDHERGAPRTEERVRARAERHERGHDVHMRRSVPGRVEVREVARVRPLGGLQAVLLPEGIEVSAGRFEVRPVAFAGFVNMDGVGAGRKMVKIGDDPDAGRHVGERRDSHAPAGSVDQFRLRAGYPVAGPAHAARPVTRIAAIAFMFNLLRFRE